MKIGDLYFIAKWSDELNNIRTPLPVLITEIGHPLFDIQATTGKHKYCLTPSQMYATLDKCREAIVNDCPAFASSRSVTSK